MATKYVVDAHTLIWHIEKNSKLGKNARPVMADHASVLLLPVIAMTEACRVVERGKCKIPTVLDLVHDVVADPRIEIVPYSEDVLNIYVQLSAPPEMHDRIIVATAIHLSQQGDTIHVLSCDPEIKACGHVSVIWD